MTVVTCIEDLRLSARRKVPRAFFDFVETGSYAQQTMRANRADLEALPLRQRVLVDVSKRTTTTTILGEPVSLPLALGPVALTGLQRGDGEILACRAAQKAGIPYTLSTVSICSIEDVAQAVEKPFWFQLYVMKDRGFVKSLIERATAAKCSALMVTVDLQINGQRHCDIKNGLAVPPSLKLANLINMASKPAWCASVLSAKRRGLGNLEGHLKAGKDVRSMAQWVGSQFDPTLNWSDIEWIRTLWPGKLILKGILNAEDARLAASSGADALVVSNHGGRQLDGARSSIAVLPKIAEAVGGQIEVMFDSGIRSGQDVMRAMALGAKSCLIGRAYVFGVGAAGEAGAAAAIEVIRKELDVSMALTGVNSVQEIGPQIVS